MSITLAEFQRRFPCITCSAEGATWVMRDTDPGSDHVPLVMLPGAGGTGDVFYRAVAGLHSMRRIVSVSYPPIDDARSLAEGVLSALSAAGIAGFDLFGSSLGGWIAQAGALRSPARIRRAMFANTFYDAGWLQRKISRDALLATPPEVHLANTLKQLHAASEETPEQAAFKQTMLALVGPWQTAQMARSALLAVLGCPVLKRVPLAAESIAILDTEDDPVVDGPTRAAMRERYGDCKQFRLATGGHYPALLSPPSFTAALVQHFGVE